MPSFLIQAVEKIRHIARVWITRAMVCLSTCSMKFKKILRPISETEDDKRREYILNIILVVSLCTLILLGATLVWNKLHVAEYAGMSPLLFALIIIVYATLLYLSKHGHWKIAATLLLIANATGTIYTGWTWGASLPETLLLTVLTIAVASVLINSTVGFITAGLMIFSLTILGIHEAAQLNIPDWRFDEISATDMITYSIMFLFISFIVWLSNREIDKSLRRARVSERLLQNERDTLEQKISERTQELVTNQHKRLAEIDRTVKVGELARGIIHDLMNPLTSMNLYMEEVANNPKKYSTDVTRSMIEKTLHASQRMSSFMESARGLISPVQLHENMCANLHKKILMACDIVAYNARQNNVHIAINVNTSITLNAHPLRIHQILVNLLSNAIDAYTLNESSTDHKTERVIHINGEKVSDKVRITASDNGCGMDEEQIKRLFIRPETTKSRGTGIGLMNTYFIIKNELGGSIDVTSKKGFGTTVIITLPIREN